MGPWLTLSDGKRVKCMMIFYQKILCSGCSFSGNPIDRKKENTIMIFYDILLEKPKSRKVKLSE